MRVLHVVPSLSPTRGGPTYVAVHLARALVARGVEVELLATRSDLRPGEEAALRATLGAIPLTLTHIVGSARLELAPALLPALVARVRRAELVHVHTVFTYPAALAPLTCRALGVPYLVRPAGTLDQTCLASRSTGRKRLALAAYVRPNLVGAAAVHVTSALERDDVAALVPDAHLELLELGVALTEAAPPVSARRIGYLGRLHPIKRIEVLLRALVTLPGTELVLAGAGDAAYERSLRDARGVARRGGSHALFGAGRRGAEARLSGVVRGGGVTVEPRELWPGGRRGAVGGAAGRGLAGGGARERDRGARRRVGRSGRSGGVRRSARVAARCAGAAATWGAQDARSPSRAGHGTRWRRARSRSTKRSSCPTAREPRPADRR